MKSKIKFYDQQIDISVKTGFVVRDFKELMYVVYNSPYCCLQFKDKSYIVETSLQFMSSNLPEADFFLCNRSTIIQLRFCKEYNRANATIVMEDGMKFRLSRRRKNAFMQIRESRFLLPFL